MSHCHVREPEESEWWRQESHASSRRAGCGIMGETNLLLQIFMVNDFFRAFIPKCIIFSPQGTLKTVETFEKFLVAVMIHKQYISNDQIRSDSYRFKFVPRLSYQARLAYKQSTAVQKLCVNGA